MREKLEKIKVLLVDDAVLITKRLASMVIDVECVSIIEVAGNYEEALIVLNKIKPQLVLLDIELPNTSGIHLLDFIVAKHPSIVVMMVTNKASAYYKKLCLQKGAHFFLDKSKDFESIPTLILKQFS